MARPIRKSPPSRKRAISVEERLLKQGLRAFAANAYADVSVDRLVGAARTTKPMLYYYFGDKAGLYRAVADYAFAEIQTIHSTAHDPRSGARDRLRAFVRAEFAAVRESPDIARFLYRTAYGSSENVPPIDHWRLFLPSFSAVAELVEAGQREGIIAHGAAPELALPLFGMIGIYAQTHLAGTLGGMLSDERADRLVDLYLHGVGGSR